MESNLYTADRISGEEMENNEDVICPSPVSFCLPGSSKIQPMKASPQYDKSHVGHSKKAKGKNNEKVYNKYHVLPTSYRLPGTTDIIPMDSIEALKRHYKELMEPQLVQSEPQPLTMEERKKGYIQETRVRRNGVTDKYYYHVQTNQEFRSLKGVHEYILFGDEQQGSFSEKIYKGTTYLESQVIGRFNFKTKLIMPIEEQIDEDQMEEDKEDEFQGRRRTTYTLPIGLYMNFELVKK